MKAFSDFPDVWIVMFSSLTLYWITGKYLSSTDLVLVMLGLIWLRLVMIYERQIPKMPN